MSSFKSTLLIGLTAIMAATTASAADLPYRKEPPAYVPPPPVFTWTGAYVGGFVGGTFGSVKSVNALDGQTVKADPTGVTAGGLLGYNYQIQSFVLGLEGDIGWNDLSQRKRYVSIPSGNTIDFKTEADYVGRVRARGGYAIDRFLLFVAGGVSFTDDKITLAGVVPAGAPFSISKGLVGWNVGAGLDWMFAPNWIARAEYIHDDYGSKTYAFSPLTGSTFQNRKVSTTDDTVRAALIYKFW